MPVSSRRYVKKIPWNFSEAEYMRFTRTGPLLVLTVLLRPMYLATYSKKNRQLLDETGDPPLGGGI